MSNTIEIYAGDSDKEVVTLTDQSGVAVDLTLYGIIFTVKKNINDTVFVIQKKNIIAGGSDLEIQMSDPVHGIFKIIIKKEDTAPLRGQGNRYIYDIQIDLNDIRKTPITGEFIVEDDITW